MAAFAGSVAEMVTVGNEGCLSPQTNVIASSTLDALHDTSCGSLGPEILTKPFGAYAVEVVSHFIPHPLLAAIARPLVQALLDAPEVSPTIPVGLEAELIRNSESAVHAPTRKSIHQPQVTGKLACTLDLNAHNVRRDQGTHDAADKYSDTRAHRTLSTADQIKQQPCPQGPAPALRTAVLLLCAAQ